MSDNNLRISFDYKYPDEAALVVYTTFGVGMIGGEPIINVRKVITGEGAVKLYSRLSGKTEENIRKEAGVYKISRPDCDVSKEEARKG